MAFRAVYPNATKFKYIVQTLVKLVDIIPFTADSEGLKVVTLSPDKTTMAVLRLPASSFEEYDLEGESETFHVASDELNRVAKRGTRNDVVELATGDSGLRVTFIDKKTGVSRSFYLSYREAGEESIGELKLELPVMARMLAEDFKDILRDAKLIGDEVEFSIEDGKLVVKALSQQKEYYNIMEEGKPLVSLTYPSGETISARYPLDALQATTKATSAAESMTLEFGANMPMKITFELPLGGTLIYWVAPRV